MRNYWMAVEGKHGVYRQHQNHHRNPMHGNRSEQVCKYTCFFYMYFLVSARLGV
jgi:hypothetical protein